MLFGVVCDLLLLSLKSTAALEPLLVGATTTLRCWCIVVRGTRAHASRLAAGRLPSRKSRRRIGVAAPGAAVVVLENNVRCARWVVCSGRVCCLPSRVHRSAVVRPRAQALVWVASTTCRLCVVVHSRSGGVSVPTPRCRSCRARAVRGGCGLLKRPVLL
jgi:hypothetical protein